MYLYSSSVVKALKVTFSGVRGSKALTPLRGIQEHLITFSKLECYFFLGRDGINTKAYV